MALRRPLRRLRVAPLAFVEDRGWQHVWGGLSVLSLAGFGLAMAGDGIVKGQITVHFSVIQRASQPRTFWAAVVLVAAASAGVVVSGLWVLFFKPWLGSKPNQYVGNELVL